MDVLVFLPVILLIALGLAIVIIAIAMQSKNRTQSKSLSRYHVKHEKYVSGQFSGQMELDLRLPYRRFRQLYPGSRLTYEEYKRLQMQTAFRRSMSSQENKRMVR